MDSANDEQDSTILAGERLDDAPQGGIDGAIIHRPNPVDCTFQTCTVCQELVQLEKRLHALKISRNASHDRLATRLPVEIICRIFIFVDRTNDYSCTQNLSKPPLPNDYICYPSILSSVCSTWREIALALPELWTNVYINVCKKFDHLDVAEEWLNRSRPMPLNLTLYVNADGIPRAGFSMDLTLSNLLRSQSLRWKYLDIQYAPFNTLYMLFNGLENLPTSKSLHLRIGDYDHYRTISMLAPLQPARIFSALPDFAELISLEWSNLTHLEICNHRMHILPKVISQAPKLKHCISYYPNPDRHNMAIILVINNSLEHLELTCLGPVDKFFRHITLPSLRHLKYIFQHYRSTAIDNVQLDDLINFLSRSRLDSTSLHTFILGFHARSQTDYDASRLFELTSLTHLSFDIWGRWEEEVHPLLLKLSDISLFPYLQELQIMVMENTAMGPSSWAVFCNIVTKHNSSARIAHVNAESGGSSCASTDSIQFLQTDTHNLNSSTIGLQHRRPALKFISISTSNQNYQMKMQMNVLLRLREAQKIGPVKLEIRNAHEDVLHNPKYTQPDGDDGAVLNFLVR